LCVPGRSGMDAENLQASFSLLKTFDLAIEPFG
jgi:hypothetical protein